MRIIYSALTYFLLPFIFLKLLWKARRNPDYAKRWRERLGKVPEHIPSNVLWWHAVSVGETLASIPLIKAFQAKYPDIPLLITTMTPTGSAQVKNQLGSSVYHSYIPYDGGFFIRRFIQRIKPRLWVIMETELWPNALHYCRKFHIPVLLANARLSEKSAKNYGRGLSFTQSMLNNITLIAAQNKESGERFLRLGLSTEKLIIAGSVKFDINIPADVIQRAKKLRAQWGSERPVWIAASTHEGEEEIMLAAAKKVPQALLILAPRHPERTAKILHLCKKTGLTVCLRSQNKLPDKNTSIFLINTLGELKFFYAVSDIAFVGGSLLPKGGHNLLEPAALELPILSGKSLYNFADIAKMLVKAKALIKINAKNAAEELSCKINYLLEHPEKRQIMGKAAKNVILKNKGAVKKHLALITALVIKKIK